MKEDRITEESIHKVIYVFYEKVKTDHQLSPIFMEAIGDDDKLWQPHLERMYDFWSSIMLSSGRYHGNPLQKHLMIPTFDIKLFNKWLALFEETVQELHTNEIANLYIDKSRRIAKSLQLGLYSL